MKEALFYTRDKDNSVTCTLCPNLCRINSGNIGACGVRKNIDGILYSLNYGVLAAVNIDPIEKKPLFHFLPSSYAYSIAFRGCNFQCSFCQNWEISQVNEANGTDTKEPKVSPEYIVEDALNKGCKSIAYTYTEPTVYFEFAYSCAKLAKKKGLKNLFITNGYITKDALEYISPYLDSANVDLKFFNDGSYKKHCRGRLEPVLDTIALMRKLNIWIEVTTLIIPGLNDSDKEIGGITSFIVSLDKGMPWHISRFHPDYHFNRANPTPISSLDKAYKIGKDKGIKYIYTGNVYTDYGENTFCPFCSKPIVERDGFVVRKNSIVNGKCLFCGKIIEGVWA